MPIDARILGLAYAYEAMTADRPCRPPLEEPAASEELRRGAGRQLETPVVDALPRVV